MKPKLSKRKLIASLGTSPLWVKPVMQSVILPVHAQTSNGLARITNAIANCGSGVIDLTNGKSISLRVDFYMERDGFVGISGGLHGEFIRMGDPLGACNYHPIASNSVEQQFNQGRHIIDIRLFALEEDATGIVFNFNSINLSLDISGERMDEFQKSISCRAIGVGYLRCEGI